MSNAIDYAKKSLVVITGASKGIGRQIGVEIAKRINSDSTLILIARSENGLNKTESLIKEIKQGITVKKIPMDLSKPDLESYKKLFQEVSAEVENAVIYHNVGSLGKLDKVLSMTSADEWRTFFDLNLFSTSLLNSAFVEKFRGTSKKLFVVNISSLCGSQPFKSMGMYGTGKAARNMYFKVLAVEEDLVVLNYSPGPVDTDMVTEVIGNTPNEDIKKMFVGLKQEKTILSADVTVNKMLDLLGKGDFKSGDLIDYYDRI